MDDKLPGAEHAMPFPLLWQHKVTEFAGEPDKFSSGSARSDDGPRQRRQASEPELVAVAALLKVVSCQRISAEYNIRPLRKGRFAFGGTLSAHLSQTCVVSLREVAETIAEDFAFEFWPQAQIDRAVERQNKQSGEEPEQDADAPDIEPIRDGILDVGRLIYEVLASSLNPYPRAADAIFKEKSGGGESRDNAEPGEPASGRHNPFAALENLKRKP